MEEWSGRLGARFAIGEFTKKRVDDLYSRAVVIHNKIFPSPPPVGACLLQGWRGLRVVYVFRKRSSPKVQLSRASPTHRHGRNGIRFVAARCCFPCAVRDYGCVLAGGGKRKWEEPSHGSRGGARPSVQCHKCKAHGHIAKDCPKKQKGKPW